MKQKVKQVIAQQIVRPKAQRRKSVLPVMVRPGQPSKFTRERRDQFLSAIVGGNTIEAACAAAGISHTTVGNWLKIARDEPQRPDYLEYVAFEEDVERAMVLAETRLVSIISTHATTDAPGDWRAAQHLLACRNPAWSPKYKLQVSPMPLEENYLLDERTIIQRTLADPAAKAALFQITDRLLNQEQPSGDGEEHITR